MTKKKRSRLNDQPIEGFADLEDELPAAAPAGARAEEPVSAVRAAAAPSPQPEPVEPQRPAAPRHVQPRRQSTLPPWGSIYTASVIVAGVGLGGTALLVTGGAADAAWKPADLFAVQNYLAPASHPLNLVAMLAVVVGVVGALGGRALAKTLRRLEAERAATDRVVDKLTALRLDNEGPWGDAMLRDHPSAGAFVAEVLGAWRLQGARLRRVNGVEGELHRLQKALAENTRDVLTGRFDSPAVGSLADEMTRFLDARNADAKELAELRRRNHEESEAIMALVQEARAWNRSTLEQIGTQGSALERMARRLEDIGATVGQGSTPNAGQAAALLAEIRRDLDTQGASRAPRVAGLDDLAAQGSKLAFQISMEVARLGPRGERLQPMSQSLEELTTSLRQALDGAGTAAAPANVGAVIGKIDALSRQLSNVSAAAVTPEALEEIGRSGPIVGRVAANLADVGRRFQAQSERLVKLGESFSELTGAPFDASLPTTGQPEPAAENGLRVIPQDPFCRDTGARAAVVDPFTVDTPLAAPPVRPLLSTEPVITAPPAFVHEPVFEPEPAFEPVAENEEDGFVIERAAPVSRMLDNAGGDVTPLELDSILPERRVEPDEPAPRPAPVEAERIYDLAEFGAVRLDEAQDEDRVHELAEFGAVRVA
jgi:hypothetical protein